MSLSLEADDGTALPDFSPGAHIDLDLGDDLVRQYSLCGLRGEPTWRIAVLRERESRGGSERAHRLSCGDRVRVRGPRNHFPLDDADEYLFIAGGIGGVTPILPMLRDAEERGVPWSLHYGGRTRDSMAFAEELAGYGDKVVLYPQDEVGPLDLTRVLGEPREASACTAADRRGLLTAIESETADWPRETLHTERFSPAEPVGPRIGDASFVVECQMSGGVKVTVAEDETILEAVERTGGGDRLLLLPGGNLRNMRDHRPRRRTGSPGFRAHRRRARSRGRDHDLRIPGPYRPTGTRSVRSLKREKPCDD